MTWWKISIKRKFNIYFFPILFGGGLKWIVAYTVIEIMAVFFKIITWAKPSIRIMGSYTPDRSSQVIARPTARKKWCNKNPSILT